MKITFVLELLLILIIIAFAASHPVKVTKVNSLQRQNNPVKEVVNSNKDDKEKPPPLKADKEDEEDEDATDEDESDEDIFELFGEGLFGIFGEEKGQIKPEIKPAGAVAPVAPVVQPLPKPAKPVKKPSSDIETDAISLFADDLLEGFFDDDDEKKKPVKAAVAKPIQPSVVPAAPVKAQIVKKRPIAKPVSVVAPAAVVAPLADAIAPVVNTVSKLTVAVPEKVLVPVKKITEPFIAPLADIVKPVADAIAPVVTEVTKITAELPAQSLDLPHTSALLDLAQTNTNKNELDAIVSEDEKIIETIKEVIPEIIGNDATNEQTLVIVSNSDAETDPSEDTKFVPNADQELVIVTDNIVQEDAEPSIDQVQVEAELAQVIPEPVMLADAVAAPAVVETTDKKTDKKKVEDESLLGIVSSFITGDDDEEEKVEAAAAETEKDEDDDDSLLSGIADDDDDEELEADDEPEDDEDDEDDEDEEDSDDEKIENDKIEQVVTTNDKNKETDSFSLASIGQTLGLARQYRGKRN